MGLKLNIAACDCSVLGSSNLVCDYQTGQCPCLSNIARANQPNVLGLVDDIQCRSCMVNTYGYHTGLGCEFCNCDQFGSNSSQCDDYGRCSCKFEGVNGMKCDGCKEGWFNFLTTGCTQCDCNPAGSIGTACGALSGVCSCKDNVGGAKCDTCTEGSFNLDIDNPEGCQKCFCYGHGTSCSSATGFAADNLYAENTGSWVLTAGNEYYMTPSLFLGNRLSSYGRNLTLEMRVNGFSNLDLSSYKAVILQGDGKDIFYKMDNMTLGFAPKYLSLTLRENLWYSVTSPADQPDYYAFYRILANLTEINIQRQFGIQAAHVMSMSLGISKLAAPGEAQVAFVENCTCKNTDYVGGLSCQECAQGHYRTNENPYENCIECFCSGRTETNPPICDPVTAECLNCRNGTQGAYCEACAPNVGGAGCTQCLAGFYGLRKEGCVECNCSMPGSRSTICDPDSGQCQCVSTTIEGRTCDVCIDNYYNVTSAGCTECSKCYGLVEDQMNILRQMRDNLTALIILLEAEDVNDVLGSFHKRLDEVQDRTQILLNFTNYFSNVKSTAQVDIARLNSTLLNLKYQLDTTAALNLARANISVQDADLATAESFIIINDTIVATREANAILWGGEIPMYNQEMAALLASLRAIEFSLTDVSDSSLQDVLRVTQIVGAIEADSERARTQAQALLTTAKTLETQHSTNKQDAAKLQVEVNRVAAIDTLTTGNVNTALSQATAADTDATVAYTNASTVGTINANLPSLSLRANQLRDQAQTLNSQAVQSTVASQTTTNRVNEAKAVTANLLSGIQSVNSSAQALLSRMDDAHETAYNASLLANTTISNASSMLSDMQLFEQKAAEVRAKAETSRQQVAAIEVRSQAVIVNATQVNAALENPERLAQQALDTANQAKTTATNNYDALLTKNQESQDLVTLCNDALDNKDPIYGQVQNQNSTTVTTANNILNNVAGSVAALETKTATAVAKSVNASRNTKATQDRIAALLKQFSEIGDIDSNRILQLRLLVEQGRITFDNMDLGAIVSTFRDAVDDNRRKIENQEAIVKKLQDQIARLLAVANRLRAGRK